MDPVSVLIPCHNEADAIGAVIRQTRAALASIPHELLVVDDGSNDETASIARRAGARVLELIPNFGKGMALRKGVEAAAHERIVVLDGDGQDDPGEIPMLLETLCDNVDMVIGSRFIGTLHPGAIHPLNRLANQAFSTTISVLFGQRITDSQAGFRAFRRRKYLALGSSAHEYDIETDTLLKAIRAGWSIREIPVQRYPRQGDRTDFNRIRHGTMILWTIVRERLRPGIG